MMAKAQGKTGKGPKGVPNKHLHARVSFLHHAATYLASRRTEEPAPADQPLINQDRQVSDSRRLTVENRDESLAASEQHEFHKPPCGGLPFYLSSQLQQVAQKSQIRLHSTIKHASCKRCGAVLHDETDHRKYVENKSRLGSKPHADILVLQCRACGTRKRYPVGATRQKRKGDREPHADGIKRLAGVSEAESVPPGS